MTYVLLLLAVLCLAGISYSGQGYHTDYMGRKQTQAIKGIFVALVFMRHFEQYIRLTGPSHRLFKIVNHYSGQLIVVMFLFYSGYGIISAIQAKGTPYVKAMPVKKIARLLVRFDLIVALYVLVNHFIGKDFHLKRILKSLIGWKSVGNSSWYIFAILACYLITYLAYMTAIRRKNGEPLRDTLILTLALLLVYCLITGHFKAHSPRYFNTIFCYGAGMWYGIYQKKVEEWLWAGKGRFCGVFVAQLLLDGILAIAFLKLNYMWIYMVFSLIFGFLVVQITMKLQVTNGLLYTLGGYVFEVYILQRLVMTLIRLFKPYYNHAGIYFASCAILTWFLAVMYKKIEDRFL